MELENKQTPKDISTETEARFMSLMERIWSSSAARMPADLDLTLAQLRLIDFVGKHVGCHLQEIADGLQLTPPTVSVAIRKLEDSGWIERRPDPEDGRASCIYLTRRSEKAVQRANTHQKKMKAQFFSGLSEEEQQTLLSLIEKGFRSIENHLEQQ